MPVMDLSLLCPNFESAERAFAECALIESTKYTLQPVGDRIKNFSARLDEKISSLANEAPTSEGPASAKYHLRVLGTFGRKILAGLNDILSEREPTGRIRLSSLNVQNEANNPVVQSTMAELVQMLSDAGIRSNFWTMNATDIMMRVNFTDEALEKEKDKLLVGEIDAVEKEVGKAIPGLDGIKTQISSGQVHWAHGHTGIWFHEEEFDPVAANEFVQACKKRGMTAKYTEPWRGRVGLLLDWEF